MCIDDTGLCNKYTRYISKRVHFVRNGGDFKMHKIEWCEGGLKLSDIATNNIGGNVFNPRIKYFVVSLDN